MKKLILTFILAFSFSISAFSDNDMGTLGGDDLPPFPWSKEQLCAFSMQDLQGFWRAKHQDGKTVFMVHVELREKEGGSNFVYLRMIDDANNGADNYRITAQGTGVMTEDLSTITGVMQFEKGVGQQRVSFWMYVYSYCSNESGLRQSVLETTFVSDEEGNKYSFEKVIEN